MTEHVPDEVPPLVVPVVLLPVLVDGAVGEDEPHAATAAALAAAVSALRISRRLSLLFLSCIQKVYAAPDAFDRVPRSLHNCVTRGRPAAGSRGRQQGHGQRCVSCGT